MNDERDNVIDAERRFAAKEQRQQEYLERERRNGKKILALGNPKRSSADGKHIKLSFKDREIFARNLGYELRKRGIEQRDLAKTNACKEGERYGLQLDSKELHRLILKPENKKLRLDRLRPDLRKYRQLILGLAEITKIDERLLASRIAYGTSIHPSSGPMSSDIERMIRLLYDLAEGMDAKFQISERFAALAARKRELSLSDPFACWPNGACWQSDSETDGFHIDFWGGGASDGFVGHTIVENTSLREFLRYVPHFCVGISDHFDYNWPVSKASEARKSLFSERYELYGHPNRSEIQAHNRARLAGTVGDVSRLRLEWDERGERISINGMPEERFLAANREHMLVCATDAGAEPDWRRDGGEVVSEHGAWICLYPSWQSAPRTVPNLIPVIVQNYGGAGVSPDREITLDDADLWLSQVAGERLIGGGTVGDRLEEALSPCGDADEPELVAEMRRTALFIENHPLLKHHRKLEASEKWFRDWREGMFRGM